MKPRPVLTVADGVTRMLSELGVEALVGATGKSAGLMRRWADPDDDVKPSFLQAVILDQLWLMSGRADPPLLAAYKAQLRERGATADEIGDLRDRTLEIGAEFGELMADVTGALSDGRVSTEDKARIAKDLRDMRGKIDTFERALARKPG